MRASVTTAMYRKQYGEVFEGDAHWKSMPVPEGDVYQWDPKSTYIKMPPYFENMPKDTGGVGGYSWRASAGDSGRQRDHRSYFARGIHRRGFAGGKIFDRPWREAARI